MAETAYKLNKKLVFNTRALIALEEIASKSLAQIIIDANEGTFKSSVQLFAAGSSMSFDEAIDFIDTEAEKGLTVQALNNAINKAFETSVFMKNPDVQKALKEVNAEEKKKTKKAKASTK